jgi:hypothetical protein
MSWGPVDACRDGVIRLQSTLISVASFPGATLARMMRGPIRNTELGSVEKKSWAGAGSAATRRTAKAAVRRAAVRGRTDGRRIARSYPDRHRGPGQQY